MNLSKYKHSDRKQREKAWKQFHDAMTELMDHLQFLLEIPDDDVTVDELNGIVACVKKLDKHIAKMGEVRLLRFRKK